jgi:hypothetical protein
MYQCFLLTPVFYGVRVTCKPNGIITGYIVSYNITKRTANVQCPVEEHDMAFNVTGNETF